MKTTLILMILLSATPVFAEQTSRYALVVANNKSADDGLPDLQFADDDGARFFEIFSSYADRSYLLTTLDADSQQIFPTATKQSVVPTRRNLDIHVELLKAAIATDHASGNRAEVFVVYTGHGSIDANGEGYLSLADGKLMRSELLRDVIRPLGADFTNVIIDACNAYYMVKSRGEKWQEDSTGVTLDDEFQAYLTSGSAQPNMPTIGVILSTAGAQEVHEWSAYGGGVFSHQLRSAMLGAADADMDGQVTYPEIEAYLVAANASVTNPRARIHVYVQGPYQAAAKSVISLDRIRNATTLSVRGGDGPVWVEDSRGLRYADLNLAPDARATLRLLRDNQHGAFWVRTGANEAVVPMQDYVEWASLQQQPTSQVPRGAVDEAFRKELFMTPFGPSFLAGFMAAKRETETRPMLIRESAWNTKFGFSYRAHAGILDVGGIQHAVGTSITLQHDSGWGMGGFADYGFASDSETAMHRISAGIQGNLVNRIAGLDVELQLRVGPEVMLMDGDGLSGDPVALRGESNLVVAWGHGLWSLFVTGGVAVDVVTRAGVETNEEKVWFSPNVGIGVFF